MPTSSSENKEIEEVYTGVEKLMKPTNPNDNVIVMRDFNTIDGEGKEGREVGQF